MNTDAKRKLATKIAMHFNGTPYIWGGDDPMRGFDCSGFVQEPLKSVGVLPRNGDWTASGLYLLFLNMKVNSPYMGCLVFWKNSDGDIVHVEYCIDGVHAIGASGGGSKTKTIEDAIKQNAYIKIRPIKSRGGIAGFVDPFGGMK